MKTLVSFISALTALMLLASCGPDTKNVDGKEFIVSQVKNGNTIVLSNMLTVRILGIENTPQSQQYLEQEVRGKTVRLTADRTLPAAYHNYTDAPRDSVFAHVAVSKGNGIYAPLAGSMLRQGFARFAATPNNDSLQVYKSYATYQPMEKMSYEQVCLKMTEATFYVDVAGQGHGTGFFISDDGLALTNCHVMQGNASNYSVYLYDRNGQISQSSRRPVSRILYSDAQRDFTIFRVQLDPGEKSPCLFLARQEPTRGQHVNVVGNPREMTARFSEGVYSGIYDDSSIGFTADIYQGNSGGPICDDYGICIGVVKSVAAEVPGVNATGNMNHGVDIRVVRQVLDQLNDVKTYCGK